MQQPPEQRGGLSAFGAALLLEALGQTPMPVLHMRIVLAAGRERGWTFDRAWGTALRSIPRSYPGLPSWRRHLDDTKEAWRAAYERPDVSADRLAA